MNKVQKLELDILKDFKKVCKEENLRYFAIGGTCIGAIRHKGFIPWDDDIDVVMPIKDYLRFKAVADDMLSSRHELIDCEKINGNTKVFIKVTNINTTYIEKGDLDNESNYQGIYVDVMPISGCPVNLKNQQKYYFHLKQYKRFHFYRNIRFRYLKSTKQKILWLLMRPLLIVHKHGYFLNRWHQELMKYDIKENNGVIFPWRKRERAFFHYDDFSGVKEKKFEDTTIFVPCGYGNYLRKDFGDYMSLPPKNERKSIHQIAIIDLNKSYKEYKTLKKGE